MGKLTGKIAVITGQVQGHQCGNREGIRSRQHLPLSSITPPAAKAANAWSRKLPAKAAKLSRSRPMLAQSRLISSVSSLKRKKQFGSLDILVNSASVYRVKPLEAITEQEFHRQFNTNVLGPVHPATQEAVKLFPAEGGNVINIGSVASSHNHSPYSIVYSATKSAVDAITVVLSRNWPPGKSASIPSIPAELKPKAFIRRESPAATLKR